MYTGEKRGLETLREALLVRALRKSDLQADELTTLMKLAPLGQISFLRNKKGLPVGYLAYAKISRYTLNLLSHDPQYPLKQEELNDGKIPLILDVCLMSGKVKPGVTRILQDMVPSPKLIAALHNHRLSLYSLQRNALRICRPTCLQAYR